MNVVHISHELKRLSSLVSAGSFDDAFSGAEKLLNEMNCNDDGSVGLLLAEAV